MSSLLYRLGRWSATHAWRVVAIWVVLLAVVGAMAGTLGKPLSSRVTIPDTQFQRVLDTLGREIPDAAGGFATVVLQSDDGAFTAAQQRVVEGVLDDWRAVPHVTRVIDPFDAQEQLDSSGAALEKARADLEAGRGHARGRPRPARRRQAPALGGRGPARAARGHEPDRPVDPGAARPGRGRPRPDREGRGRPHHG